MIRYIRRESQRLIRMWVCINIAVALSYLKPRVAQIILISWPLTILKIKFQGERASEVYMKRLIHTKISKVFLIKDQCPRTHIRIKNWAWTVKQGYHKLKTQMEDERVNFLDSVAEWATAELERPLQEQMVHLWIHRISVTTQEKAHDHIEPAKQLALTRWRKTVENWIRASLRKYWSVEVDKMW